MAFNKRCRPKSKILANIFSNYCSSLGAFITPTEVCYFLPIISWAIPGPFESHLTMSSVRLLTGSIFRAQEESTTAFVVGSLVENLGSTSTFRLSTWFLIDSKKNLCIIRNKMAGICKNI
ncbi:hypothetical protein GALMADRAFT_737953 [Galerina marginata CBS 339.88]|uniref:Uncharacterized protein n=1 Tax=Galerina marginata (strain CBS 339.88) TaxID=685588 RepID=A0A067SPK2_GALM3|nr:hypothetical protein GALMADRAFT_737953 [Galerina marginata CBS 339.88]